MFSELIIFCRRVELAQFKAVSAHPQFKANPMATLREHLANRLARDAEQKAVAQRQLETFKRREQRAEKRLENIRNKKR